MELAPPIDVDATVLGYTNVVQAEADWASGTTYAALDRVARMKDGKGRAWISLVSSNHGNDPATDDGTHWEDAGPTLPWQMFGESATAQSTHEDLVYVVLDLPADARFNYAWFGNLSGATLQLTATDAVDGVVHDVTYSLVADSGVDDWWKWFVYPVQRLAKMLVSDLPPIYSGLTVEIKIAEAGATVGCGAAVLGLGQSLGNTQWGVQLGRRDFSLLQDTDYGDREITSRGFRQTLTCTTNLDNAQVDALGELLAQFRAKPALFIADSGFASMAVWGFVKSYQVQVPGPALSFTSLDIESMTQL